MKKFFPFLVALIMFSNCKDNSTKTIENTLSTKTNNKEELEELYNLMQGSFSSERQSKTDSSYYNVALTMYPIWKEKGKFLYVEQALYNIKDRPYRQRVYEITSDSDSTFQSSVYTLKNEKDWIGIWKKPKALDTVSIKDISLKEGCEVILKRIAPNHFVGKTSDTTCESSLRGATFARSEVTILEDKIISWDRGFDADGNYAWGTKEGGYVFEKIKSFSTKKN